MTSTALRTEMLFGHKEVQVGESTETRDKSTVTRVIGRTSKDNGCNIRTHTTSIVFSVPVLT